jgi:hypothetical protein
MVVDEGFDGYFDGQGSVLFVVVGGTFALSINSQSQLWRLLGENKCYLI